MAELDQYLDIYQIHSATLQSRVLERREVLRALGRLKARGVVIGLTVSGTEQSDTIERALEIAVGREPLFQTVQATWNLLEPSAANLLAQAHAAGMGVIIKEVLANGRLTPRNQDPGFSTTYDVLQEQAGRLNTTIDALAIAAALAQPWADVVLSGAVRVEHLHANLNALALDWDQEVAESLQGIGERPAEYWEKRSNLAWN